MSICFESEIAQFRLFSGVSTPNGRVVSVATDIVKFTPSLQPVDTLKLGFLALVHGNEIIGLPIINSVLKALLSGALESKHEIYFGLGNTDAAYANKRFIENDLNRCFGQSSTSTPEDRRAREIEEHLLNKVDYLIDLHQTIHPSKVPFFIFQYLSEKCFERLALMNPGLTTILQFDAIGDSQNLSTDEYLRSRGRFGVALELGQIGFSVEMFELGRSICEGLIKRLNSVSRFHELPPVSEVKRSHRFFEITGKIHASDNGTTLKSEFQNFMQFENGQALGEANGKPALADRSGFVLFPKLNQVVDKGQVLFHVCSLLASEKLRSLSGADTDLVEATSLSFEQHVHPRIH